jgi:16S rRNA (uracil1498-N3)-methyltransferase
MRRRFYAPVLTGLPGRELLALDADESRHLRDVLRLKVGDEVFLFDGKGREYRARIADISIKVFLDVLGEVEPASPESPLLLTLGIALLKGEKFDLVIQKGTELGVSRIVPLETKHADVQIRDGIQRRVLRWRRVALEAAKQSGRASVPQIESPVTFEHFITTGHLHEDKPWRALFAERGGVTLAEAASQISRPKAAHALVGPEGGWSTEELDRAAAHGWNIITLGGRILRAETAAIAITALLQNLFGDLT